MTTLKVVTVILCILVQLKISLHFCFFNRYSLCGFQFYFLKVIYIVRHVSELEDFDFFFGVFIGIFAFKCARAEELFNMLQEIMQNNSINVVEEPVVERNNHQTELEVPRTPRTPTSKYGSSVR